MASRNHNLFSLLQNQLVARAKETLLITETDETYTYADADEASAKLASFMTRLGLQPGDRVSVQVEKSPQVVFLYLACLRAGFVFHPLNTGYKTNELRFFLDNAAPAMVVCSSDSEPQISALSNALNIKHVFTLNANNTGTLLKESANEISQFKVVSRQADDMAVLLYSSGTTGVPKGIMLSHENIASNAQTLTSFWGFHQDDTLLHALPIFHVHGLFVALGCVLLSGARMRWMSAFNAKKVNQYLPECSVMMGVPTFYTRLLNLPDFSKESCRNIRVFISGSAPLLLDTFNEFEARTGHQILERYGMSETNMNTSNPLNGQRKPGTVGLPLPGIQVRVNDDQGHTLGNNQIGNLQVKGNNVFKGYWKLPEKTAEDLGADGFFNTGDQGQIDEHGYVSIIGRAKDLIITGGLNVYPKEVESQLDDMDGINESAVIGVPHSDFGEAVVAVVVAHSGVDKPLAEDDVISALKENLANFKVPKKILYLPELPRNTMGKVQKATLREQFKELFR